MNDNERDHVRVLLVDDNAFARSISRRVLRSAGVSSILEAASGREGLDLLGQSVDVVFCDLMMPVMDGIQMIRHLAALATAPALVIVSSTNAVLLKTAETTARARGLCVLGAIEKPLTVDAVRCVLSRLGEPPPPGNGHRRGVTDLSLDDFDGALAQEQFLLYFQPKILLADNSVVGFESLVRWLHPDKGMILPGEFIPAAEQNGRIDALTDLITILAMKQCAAWASAGFRTKVSINLSAHMLVDLDLPDRMAREAERFGIDPRQLILEITESGMLQEDGDTLDILARLHMKGFPLSIDDFGTGYSSMEQLSRVPFAEMKIDRAFVHGAAENAKARAILESSADLGRSLHMSVVAEGVETQKEWNTVRTAGVHIVQGYFAGRPMAAKQLPAWLNKWARSAKHEEGWWPI